MTRTKHFLRQNFFKVFLKTTFIHDLCHADHYEPKIFFRFLKSGLEGFPIMSVNVRYWHKRTWADKHDETFLQMIKDSSRNRPEIRLNPVPAGYPASKSSSGSGWKKFAGFQCFYRRNQKKIFGF